jgi:hypothetical protein
MSENIPQFISSAFDRLVVEVRAHSTKAENK